MLLLAVWLVVLYRRQRRRFSARQTYLLMLPKGLIVLLLIFAYFDPAWSVFARPRENTKVLVVVDTSSSMEVEDASEGSRLVRARELEEQIQKKMKRYVNVEVMEFDRELRPGQETKSEGIRETDLGQCLVSLAELPEISNCLGIVMLTDGGDESLQSVTLGEAPMFVAGVGSDPAGWNDVAITDVEAPEVVEEQTDFEVTVDLAAYAADDGFASGITRSKVVAEEMTTEGWQVRGTQTVDLSSKRGRAAFRIAGTGELGARTFRVRAATMVGELSDLNNVRRFVLDVQKKTLHILFYAQELGWDFRQIRKELIQDPSVAVTTLYRITGDRFVVQGDRQRGDEILEAGFPVEREVLELYKCIVIGSFEASLWKIEQMRALREYVRGGGSVVFLGGEHSFGRGGYVGTPLESLFPWRISASEPELQRGRFPINLVLSAQEHGIMAEMVRLLKQQGAPKMESINIPGPLRPGASRLLAVTVGNQTVAGIALQNYGQGQCLGVASNTLWKWARQSELLRQAFGSFWRQGVRYVSGTKEGGRFLSVEWDQGHYRPSEQGAAMIRVAGSYKEGQLHLRAALTRNEQVRTIPVESASGPEKIFVAKMVFAERGYYAFELQVFDGEELLETYAKTHVVGPQVNEGANLEVDHGFLRQLAGQSQGAYFAEGDFDQLLDTLRSRVMEHAVSVEMPLVEDRYIYIIIVLVILAAEWAVRRRLNLF